MNYNQKSIFKELYYQPYKRNVTKLYDHAKDNLTFVQRLGLIRTLPLHQGCVNTLSWNESGSLLLSGSDDQHLIVTNGHTYQVCHDYRTSHRANIFSAKFMPASGDHNIVSCSGDGIVLYTDLERPSDTYYNQFNCHSGTSYEVITIPNDPNTFFSCGEDGTVRWFDLRVKTRCKKTRCKDDVLILHHRAVTALSINPTLPHELAIGSSDSTVRTFDRRMLGFNKNPVHNPVSTFTVPELEERTYRITSLSYSPDGRDMLVSYSSDHLYLFRLTDEREKDMSSKKGGKSNWSKLKCAHARVARRSPPPVRRLRLRGDWSDTGPDARPERDTTSTVSIGQARPQLQATLMERMTNVLFRMLNDPLTRAALSAGGEDSLETNPPTTPTHNHHSLNLTQQSTSSEMSQNSATGELPEEQLHDQPEQQLHEQSEQQLHEQPEQQQQHQQQEEQLQQEHQPQEEQLQQQQYQQPSCSTMSGTENEFNNLHDKLTTLRHGFIEKHGSEPSVSLHYSDQSSSNSTIKLGVGDELNRSTNYNLAEPSEQSSSTASSSRANETIDIQGGDNDMDFSSNDEMMPDSTPRTNVIKSSSDIELDFSDSDDDDKDSINMSTSGDGISDIFEPHVKQKYIGHRNARTMIKEATFWGNDYVMSGSDCGHVFIWDRASAELVMLLQADHHVVNCLQPHPTLPILATSGIDHDVKLWAPILDEPNFDTTLAEDLMKRNEVMLEETRDTITVPAAFMIRMLACLNQIRRTGTLTRSRRQQQPEPEPDPDP